MTGAPFTITHETTVAAAPEALFALVADTEGAPRYAPAQMHAEILARDPGGDLIKRWVYGEKGMRAWTFRRVLDRDALRIVFTHVDPAPPVLDQRGTWTFAPDGDGGTRMAVAHTIVLLDPAAEAGLRAGFDRQIPEQLAGYRVVAALGADLARRYVSAEESIVVPGTPDELRARLLDDGIWTARHPGATGVAVTPLGDDAELVEITGTGNRYFRLTPTDTDVVYKSLDATKGLHAQLGRQRIRRAGPDRVEVVLGHTVTLPLDPAEPAPDPEALHGVIRDELRRLAAQLAGGAGR